jgi:serine/threonine protein kinase
MMFSQLPIPDCIPRVNAKEVKKGALLGEGGFGCVYKGKLNNQVVAIKEIRTTQPEALYIAETEIQMLACFKGSSYITQMIAITNDFFPMIVLEFYTGGDLISYITKVDHPTELQVLLCDTKKGLETLHRMNVIHRDVKPDNIMIRQKTSTNRARALLGDLGMAAMLPSNRMLTTLCGTKQYAAPEVLSGQAYNESADIYSFGLTSQKLFKYRKWDVPGWVTQCMHLDPTFRPALNQTDIVMPCKEGLNCRRGDLCWFTHKPIVISQEILPQNFPSRSSVIAPAAPHSALMLMDMQTAPTKKTSFNGGINFNGSRGFNSGGCGFNGSGCSGSFNGSGCCDGGFNGGGKGCGFNSGFNSNSSGKSGSKSSGGRRDSKARTHTA